MIERRRRGVRGFVDERFVTWLLAWTSAHIGLRAALRRSTFALRSLSRLCSTFLRAETMDSLQRLVENDLRRP